MSTKKLKAEYREEKRRKLKEKQVSLSSQVKKMRVSGNYKGDVKKFIKSKRLKSP